MQKEVAVNSFDLTQFRQVAVGTADGLEGRLTGFGLSGFFVVGRPLDDGHSQVSYVVNEEVALFSVHIKTRGRNPRQSGVSRLSAAGDLEPHLAGRGG